MLLTCDKLNQMKDKFTSEFKITIIDIFLDFVKADNTIINIEGLEYLINVER